MQLLGGTALSAEQAASLGASLAGENHTGTTLADVLKPYDETTRGYITAAFITAGGDAQVVNTAYEILKTKSTRNRTVGIVFSALATASFAACVYHGYKRNNSVGWALGWGILGTLMPVLAPTLAVAQGYAKPKR